VTVVAMVSDGGRPRR